MLSYSDILEIEHSFKNKRFKLPVYISHLTTTTIVTTLGLFVGVYILYRTVV
jgi:hypothetical protein